MASKIVDLTEYSSDGEPSRENAPPTRKSTVVNQDASRSPLNAIKNDAKPDGKWTGHIISGVLHEAIFSLSEAQLRTQLIDLASQSPQNIEHLKTRLTVPGKEVTRYHEDTCSEDASEVESEEDESESDSADGEESTSRQKERKSIAIVDDQMTPRYATCENCNEEFDVTCNEKGDCVWHSGMKELYEDGDFWADHDPDCHGDPSSFEDDPNYGEGFFWDCCEKLGDEEGCKSTKHKAKVNIITSPALVTQVWNKKRKAEEPLHRSRDPQARYRVRRSRY